MADTSTVTTEKVEVKMTVEEATRRDELPNERRVRPRSPTASTPEGRMSQQFSMTQEASSSSTVQPSQPPQQSCPQMLVPEPIQSGGVPHYYEQPRQSCANPPCSQPATAQVSVGRDVAMAFCNSCARVCQSFLEPESIEMTMEQISFLSHLNVFTGQTLKDTFYEAVRRKFAGTSGQSEPRGQSVPQKPTSLGALGQYIGYPSPQVGFERPQVGSVSPQLQSLQHALMHGSYTGSSNEAPTPPIYGGGGQMPNQVAQRTQSSVQNAYLNGQRDRISRTTGIFQFGESVPQPTGAASATANILGGFELQQLGVTARD